MSDQPIIREFRADDSLESLTGLLHRAYAPLAAMGFKYFASHQSVEKTRSRIAAGSCLIAELNDRLGGTITWYRGDPTREVCPPIYRDPLVAYFGQFGVEPELQHHGIGLKLLRAVEEAARNAGCTRIALDTAENASHLVAWYTRLGFSIIDYTQWEVTNYRSVVMIKSLT
jgi:GNAT superfamily N-acetyltransferase